MYISYRKLTLEFYEKRINQLEGSIEKIKDDMMDMVHQQKGIKNGSGSHSNH